MSELELFADAVEGRLMAVVVKDGVPDDLYADAATPVRWGALYLGRVVKIDTKLQAALVDLGGGLTGFLPAKHVRTAGADSSDARSGIAELLKGGQTVIVQVKSEGRAGSANENEKMPRLTMKLYVPGLFLAYSPTAKQVTISRKIESEEILALTAKLKGAGGWIVRSPAEKASADEIEGEARRLQDEWQSILAAKEALGDKPGLLKEGPDAVARALADYDATAFGHIYAGDKKVLGIITGWCAAHLPALATSKRLRLFKPEKPGQRLFDSHDIFGTLESLEESAVPLPSGASLVIERTAALTVIDVNQGGASGIAAANLDAAPAIARQCRLRNLSGAILVDFINMDKKDARRDVLETLTAAVADDPAAAQVHGFTRLGMVEITRRRRTASLAENPDK
ncbi:MAG: ribonuclease E/G [Alphaproteobacteria bacterium]|nr:ribonuclease E/G [Alphaproteobacteria bacterium]